MKALRFLPIMVLAVAGILSTTAMAGAVPIGGRFGPTYRCTGGNIRPGTYGSILVTGVCYMPAGNITVRGDLTVNAGALLDAVTPGDPVASANPLLPAEVSIGGNVFVGAGGVLLLGCAPGNSCPTAYTYDTIGGSLTGIGALGVVIHAVTIGGSFSLLGGGSGSGPDVCAGTQYPWSADSSLANGEGPGHPIPVYSDASTVSIGGDLSVVGLNSCWLGTIRDQIGGSATFADNTMGDPDAMEVDSNLIGNSLTCNNNLPAVQFGDSAAAPNIVGGLASGECAFNVLDPNPAPAPGVTAGPLEHISVAASSLGTYAGTDTQTVSSQNLVGVTEYNDTLVAQSGTDVLSGSGLTGSLTDMLLSTVWPYLASSFTAVLSGTLSFSGQSGNVTILAQGTTSTAGVTSGTFMIVSGGGGLATLAGYGTFTSLGQPAGTLQLTEHLGIT
jgi:hypothetical protein